MAVVLTVINGFGGVERKLLFDRVTIAIVHRLWSHARPLIPWVFIAYQKKKSWVTTQKS